jgi:hypothetical protein
MIRMQPCNCNSDTVFRGKNERKSNTVTFADLNRLEDRIDRIKYLDLLESICDTLPASVEEQLEVVELILDVEAETFYVVAPEPSSVEIKKEFDFLEMRLTQQKRCSAVRPTVFLPLAIILASSLLQLHTTPWLSKSEMWYKNSICFPLDDCPYVAVEIGKTRLTSACSLPNTLNLNPYLVGLGIILLELAEGKSLEQWLTEKGITNFEPSDLSDKAKVALDWLLESRVHRYEKYSQVVRRCLDCLFQPPPPVRSLEDETFQQTVYHDIISELEEMHKAGKRRIPQK